MIIDTLQNNDALSELPFCYLDLEASVDKHPISFQIESTCIGWIDGMGEYIQMLCFIKVNPK
tara:strand:- start:1215 stop:1400 length:186 start_codon:yes stop_codon:yes gene_type:complete